MYAVICEASTVSGEGSQSFSPRSAGFIGPGSTRFAVERADELPGEVLRALERVGVESVGDVGGRVMVARDPGSRLQAGDGGGAPPVDARGEGVAGHAS